eukprot:64654-Rhodomonas_salina.1
MNFVHLYPIRVHASSALAHNRARRAWTAAPSVSSSQQHRKHPTPFHNNQCIVCVGTRSYPRATRRLQDPP